MSKKNTFKKEKIDTDKYVNTETGETLASEQPNLTSVNKINSDYVKFKSESFFIIDDNVMNYLKDILSKADMYHVIIMAQMVYGSYNYLHDKNLNVHNRESLQRDLNIQA